MIYFFFIIITLPTPPVIIRKDGDEVLWKVLNGALEIEILINWLINGARLGKIKTSRDFFP
jgi:hypothetical protein